MEPSQLLLTALRTLGVYALILILLRLIGKREIGTFTPFDLLVALMLGEIVDEAIYGDVNFWQFSIAAVAICALQYITGWASCRSAQADRVLQGTPTIMIRDGQLQREAMRQERMSEQEIMALLREQMIDDVREVKLGTLETSGQLSIILEEWAEPLQKGDLPGAEAEQKQRDTGGRKQPTDNEQTYSPRALGQEAA